MIRRPPGSARSDTHVPYTTLFRSGGTGVLEVVAEYEAHRLGQELDGETYLKADASWFRSIVAGVVRDQVTIDPLVRSALQADRSEEHTSELQSLMRISYAVFCLKKTKNNRHDKYPHQTKPLY